jgi:NADH:ubiquinone oxidoreductase subunit 4 (subunit M)
MCFSLVGISIAFGSSSRCSDIKKTTGSPSILHLNFTSVSIHSLNFPPSSSGIITSLPHGSCSVGLSSIAGPLINKTHPRYTDARFLIDHLFLIFSCVLVLCNLSLPGPLNPISESSCSICLLEIDSF